MGTCIQTATVKYEFVGVLMIGIVILNYNHWEDTRKCIISIHDGEPSKSSYQIYVVDNASPSKPSENILKELAECGVCLIKNTTNRGYAAGNNLGIKQALKDGCDTILISNSDVRYESDSITKMKEYLANHPDVGIVGPKIKLSNGQTQRECMAIRTGMKEKYLLRTRLYLLFPKYNSRYWGREHDYECETFDVYAVLGCCFMMSRACALEVTPLDENTFLYEEELIIGIRMEQLGWKTVYYPKSVIHHLHGQSTGNLRVTPFPYTCNVSSEMYFCRNYLEMERWQMWPLWGYRTLLYLARCLRYKDFRKYWKRYREESTRWL